MPKLILASSSPQRRELLEGLGVRFSVIPSMVDEAAYQEADPIVRATELARLKARDVAVKNPGSIVIGCDTLVVASDGTLLEKPGSPEEALSMLRLQSGATSVVHSAVCVVDPNGGLHEGVSSSTVTFDALSQDEMQWWIETGLWQGRSGGFQIDGHGQLMIRKIEGDWTGIVGLPVFLTGRLLSDAGYDMKNGR